MYLAVIIWGSVSRCIPPKKISYIYVSIIHWPSLTLEVSNKSKALCLHMLCMLSKEKKFSLISSSATEEIQWFYQAIPNVLHECSINHLINDFFYHMCHVSCIDNGECTLHKIHFINCKGGFAMYLGIFVDKVIVDAHKSCSPVQAIDLCTNHCNLCMVIICKPKTHFFA